MNLRSPPASLTARYDVIDQLDDDRGSKHVYLAADRQGGPDAVIVRIPIRDRGKLEREVAVLQRLDSAYLPRIFDLCIEPRGSYHTAYLVVEYCEGPTLAQVVWRGALAVTDAAPILVELARGLAVIHGAGALHRDLRLENAVLVSSDRGTQLKLLDLALAARLEVVDIEVADSWRDATRMLPYMPREVMRGDCHDARSDAYALGVCCFRILTGELPIPPRRNESDFDYMLRTRAATIDLSLLPAELPGVARAAIARMLDADRDRRPVLPEVVAAFEQAFGAPPLPAAPPVARPPAGERRS